MPRANERMLWVVALVLSVCLGACGKSSETKAHPPKPAPALRPVQVAVSAAPAAPKKRSRLPEDPIAGKKSEQQWREHLAHEEEERQMLFDRPRLQQHRAVIKLINSARARYDRARTKPALDKVRAEMPDRIAEIKKRISELDPWGNNSRLHPDYDALLASLAAGYPDAKNIQLEGHDDALKAARADFDRHLEHADEWLYEVEHEPPEGEGGERAREQREREARKEQAREPAEREKK